MDKAQVLRAKAEAERFIAACEECLPTMTAMSLITGSKHTAAVKRSSMDLTRALAELRGRTK